jgi:peroxiredoxin
MSQAEIAGGKVSLRGEVPRIGYRLRDFMLRSTAGAEVRLSDYRGRSDLVLIFGAVSAERSALIRDLTGVYQRIREEQAEVLLIVPAAVKEREQALQIPFPVLVDSGREIYAEYGLPINSDPIFGIFIADRFGELAASYVASDTTNATSASILKWLEFINSQCPECEPPEWPLED